MGLTREQICLETSEKLSAAAGALPAMRGLIGLDGFVDSIIAVVDKRHEDGSYDIVPTIAAFGKKISAAAGESSNYELVVQQQKLGGNGPIMANALAAMGVKITYVGTLGYPSVHPVFEDFTRQADVHTIGEGGYTDALEFEDGKIMLGKITQLNEITWDALVERIGKERFIEWYREAKLVGMVNWTMLPQMSRIWEKLIAEVLPAAGRSERHLFIDLADPEKRTHADIREALNLLTRFQEQVEVTLGLNLKESSAIAEVLGLGAKANAEAAIEETAKQIREKLKVGCVVIHPRRGAAAATATASARFAGPFVKQPKISTGAGDHFNAGFCLGRILGFDLEHSLCTGVGTSGFYVRSAQSPSARELAEFIAELPPPQET